MTPPDPSSARIQITGGGHPTEAEVAALVVALTPVAAPTDGEGRDATVPAWARAALLENVGGRRPARPSDLDGPLVMG